MVKHIFVIDFRTVLRTILIAGMPTDAVPAAGTSRGGGMTRLLLVAAALVAVMPAAGVVSGVEWAV